MLTICLLISHFVIRQGLSELDIHVIDLVPDNDHAEHEEAKVSSSSTRARLLGRLLREPKVGHFNFTLSMLHSAEKSKFHSDTF